MPFVPDSNWFYCLINCCSGKIICWTCILLLIFASHVLSGTNRLFEHTAVFSLEEQFLITQAHPDPPDKHFLFILSQSLHFFTLENRCSLLTHQRFLLHFLHDSILSVCRAPLKHHKDNLSHGVCLYFQIFHHSNKRLYRIFYLCRRTCQVMKTKVEVWNCHASPF